MKFLLALLLTSSILYSQSYSVYKFTLPELKITQLEKGKEVTYEFVDERNLFLVCDTMMIADQQRYKYQVPINNIRKISILNGNQSLKGVMYCGIAGSVLGLVTGLFFANSNLSNDNFKTLAYFSLAGGLTGGLLGFIIGALVPDYDHYEKFSKNTTIKQNQLKDIFAKHEIKNKKL